MKRLSVIRCSKLSGILAELYKDAAAATRINSGITKTALNVFLSQYGGSFCSVHIGWPYSFILLAADRPKIIIIAIFAKTCLGIWNESYPNGLNINGEHKIRINSV